MRVPTASVEADLAALRAAAERAGTAMACLFSTSDEFEAEQIRARRPHQPAAAAPSRFGWLLRRTAGVSLLVAIFMMA